MKQVSIFRLYALCFFVLFIFNFAHAQNKIVLKDSYGNVVEEMSYSPGNLFEKAKISSICFYKSFFKGLTCESVISDLSLSTSKKSNSQNFDETSGVGNSQTIPQSTSFSNGFSGNATGQNQQTQQQVVYQVIERAVPGPQGPAGRDGKDGLNGKDGQGGGQVVIGGGGGGQYYGPGPIDSPTNGGNANFANLVLTTLSGAGLTSCNATTSKLVYNASTKLFECASESSVTANVNGSFTNLNATGTSQLTTIYASTTNASTTNTINLISTNGTVTNSTSTNISTTNLTVSGSSTLASTTISNASIIGNLATNILNAISSTFISLFASTAYVTTLNASTTNASTSNFTTQNGTNSTITNSTTTNSTSTNSYITNLLSAGATTTALYVSGTATTTLNGSLLSLGNLQGINGFYSGALGASSLNIFGTGTSTFGGGLNVTGYTRIDGTVDLNSHKVINVLTPTNSTDAANKSYVDSLALGLSWQSPVINLASTTITSSTTGDRYIVSTTTNIGLSPCLINNICQNIGGGIWSATTPATGTTVYVASSSQPYTYSGSWVSMGSSVAHNSTTGIEGGDGSHFYHLGQTDYSNLTSANAQLGQLLTTGSPSFAGLTLSGTFNASNISAGTGNFTGALSGTTATFSSGITGNTITTSGSGTSTIAVGQGFAVGNTLVVLGNANNIGIGTTAPTANLSFTGSPATINNVTSGGGISLITNTTGVLSLDTGTTGGINIGTGAFSKNIALGNQTGGTSLQFFGGADALGGGVAVSIPLNLANAFQVKGNSGTNYFGITTTSGGSAINFGDNSTTTGFNFLGVGTSTFNGGLAVGKYSKISATLDLVGNKIINISSPTNSTDAANKAYVDSFAQGLSWQSAVLSLATTTISASTTGDRYIIYSAGGISSTGCSVNQIAQNIGIGQWSCTNVSTSTTVFVNSPTNQPYTFNGTTWNSISNAIAHNSTTGIEGGDGSHFFHLGQADYNNLTSVNSQLSQLLTTGSPSFTALTITGSTTIADGTAGIPGLAFLADTNTGIFRPASDNFAVSTGGVERFRVDSNGYLGVGVTSPTSMLDVANFINTSGTTGGYKIDGNLVVQASSTLNNLLLGGSVGNASMTGSQNTAIGALSFGNNTTGSRNYIIGTFAGSANTTGSFNIAIGRATFNSNTTGSGNVAIGNEAMRTSVTGSENVFIGNNAGRSNTSATNTVIIGGGAADNGFAFHFNQGVTGVGYAVGARLTNNSDYNTFLGYQSGASVTSGSNNLIIGSATSTNSVNTLTTGSQNILIGNNIGLPSATANGQLDIGNIIYGNSITGTLNTVSTGNIGVGTTSPWARFSILAAANSSSTVPQFAVASSTAISMVITNAGNVGVGTSTPSARFTTIGTVRFANFGAGSLQTDALGNISVSSDINLKNVDGFFTRGLEDLVKVNPISYHWNEISGLDMENSYTGFSAQNVQSAIPEAVGTSSTGFLSLSDRPILATVVNAVKEIARLLDNMKESITTKVLRSDTIHSQVICLAKTSGEVCINGDKLQTILDSNNINSAPSNGNASEIPSDTWNTTNGDTSSGNSSASTTCAAPQVLDQATNTCN